VYSSGDGLWKVGVNGTGKTLLAANPSGRTWREVDWSVNGKIVAGSIGGWGYTSEIRIMNADGSNPTIIVPDAPGGLSGVRFAPDGQSIMYVYDVSGYEDSGGGPRDNSIFVAGIDGSSSINISQASGKVSGTNDYMGTVSPDGKRILFSSCLVTLPCSQMVMNRDGTQRQTVLAISSALGGDAAGMIDWRGTSAVTGDLITYLQNGDVYSTTTLGGTATRLTTSGKVIDQRISPDRSKIAYTQEISAGSSYDVRIMNADGSGAVSVGTKTQGNHIWGSGLSFSPDGSSLAYSSGDGLWKVGVNGTGKTLLAASPSGRTWREVDWSANGKIVAQSIAGWAYTSEIRIMNADGSNPTIIVPDAPGALHGVRFAPDGQSIFYNYDVSGHEESSGRQIDTSIFVAGIDGSNPVNLSQASGRVSGTRDYVDALSPNGTRILFTNCQDNIGCSMMVMNRDGTQRQTVIAGTASLSISVEGVDWRGATIATTITFGAMPVVTVGGTGTGTVSATSTSGLPVTFSSLTTPVCTVSGSTVTGIAAGICTLAANQSGNGTYAAAPQATLSFSIAASIVPPGPPTITSIKAGSGSATLNFSAPGNTGGSPISSYMASCTATGRTTRTATGTSSPISVGNLTGGVIYQCTLTATNGGGLSSAASAAMPVTAKKNSITPILMLLLD
jgi:Tol biopolymer transport system component